ncbi:MAG: Fic family protein [Raoultibacter sp.]
MEYVSVVEIGKKWGISERSVRNYCAQKRIPEAFLTGKTWHIPADASKPLRSNRHSDEPLTLLKILKAEKEAGTSGGIYHKVQIELTYNSNHMEGSQLSHDQTRYIYETNTIGTDGTTMNVDDIVETANHFRCINLIIDQANHNLNETLCKLLHSTLKSGTSDSRKDWFAVGAYKRLPNEVSGKETTAPEEVAEKIRALLQEYNKTKKKTFSEILDFHYQFEAIHPFQDGNGRVGRLILFKECLRNDLVPFIIDDELKMFYYQGLQNWPQERGFLTETCLSAQDKFKKYLGYFRIQY